MFTGIIQATGRVKTKKILASGATFEFEAPDFVTADVTIGDSIAVNGVCLTVVGLSGDAFKTDVSGETLACSMFANLPVAGSVNLEKSLRFNQGIDGHFVSGHVDGVGEIVRIIAVGSSQCLQIKAPENLTKYIAKKGAICLNGVSLTVNEITQNIFSVNVVPHTLSATTLGAARVRDLLNIEVDMIARHIEQLLASTTSEHSEDL